MTIDKQVLRQIAESVDREEWYVLDNGDADYQVIVSGSLERGATYRSYQPVTNEISNKKIAAFIAAFNPKVALALLNEVEAAEHTAAVDHEAACSLVEENETLKRRIAEQREYYEGVIADGSKRIAELESKNGYLRTIAHEQNELAIRASLDSNNATVEMGRLHKRIAELEIQEHRKAAAEPVLYVMGMGYAFDAETASTCKGAVDSWVGEWNQERLPGQEEYRTVPLYATPQPLNDAEWAELQERRKADSAEPDYIRYDCGCCGWETIEDWRDNDACPKCNHKPMGKTELYTAPPASERERIRREHAEWSDKTFGDVGPVGPLKHLSKETLEVAAEPDDLSEWADMQFLLWDAQRRAGISDGEITLAMKEKLAVNKRREWPEPKDGEPRLHIKEQPVPIVPPAIEPDYEVIKGILPTTNPDEYACCIAADMWNACRAAMLNGGKS